MDAKVAKNILAPDNLVRLYTSLDAKNKVLEKAIIQAPQDGKNDLSFMNT